MFTSTGITSTESGSDTRRHPTLISRQHQHLDVEDDDSNVDSAYFAPANSSNDNDHNTHVLDDDDNNARYAEDDEDDEEIHLGYPRASSSQEYFSEPNNSILTNVEDDRDVNNSSSSVSSDLAPADSSTSPVGNSDGDTPVATIRRNQETDRSTYNPETPAGRVRGTSHHRTSTGQSLSPTAGTPSRSRRSGAMSGGRTTPITTPATGTAAAVTMSASSASAPQATSKLIHAGDSLDLLYRCSRLREVTGTSMSNNEALSWQLSSAKPGNGVEQIRDISVETYWQSDGVTQPHWIQIHFQRRIAISHVCLYLDYHLDESYTPKTITIEAGMTAQDLVCATSPIPKIEFHEPSGWCIIPLCAPPDPLDGTGFYDDDDRNTNMDDDDDDDEDNNRHDDDGDDTSRGRNDEEISLEKHFQKPLIKAHTIRISILSMHQNGRDTHVRRLALFARQQQPNRFIQQPSAPFHSLSNTIPVPDSQDQFLGQSIDIRRRNPIRNLDIEEVEFNLPRTDLRNENNDSIGFPPANRDPNQSSLSYTWYTESWNHRRNTASSDFTTIGRNPFSSIR